MFYYLIAWLQSIIIVCFHQLLIIWTCFRRKGYCSSVASIGALSPLNFHFNVIIMYTDSSDWWSISDKFIRIVFYRPSCLDSELKNYRNLDWIIISRNWIFHSLPFVYYFEKMSCSQFYFYKKKLSCHKQKCVCSTHAWVFRFLGF